MCNFFWQIIWYKDEIIIESSEHYEVELKQEANTYFTCLTVHNVQLSDAGKYKLQAKNELGETKAVVSMVVKGKLTQWHNPGSLW